jgi:hypothetical protein
LQNLSCSDVEPENGVTDEAGIKSPRYAEMQVECSRGCSTLMKKLD